MAIYISPNGNSENWDEKPEGYFTPEQWAQAHSATEDELAPGPHYVRRDGRWWLIRLSRKDFLLLCGLEAVVALNAAINSGNATAKAAHDILTAAEQVDLSEQATRDMIQLLTTAQAGQVLSEAEAGRILRGLEYEPAVAEA